MLRSKISPSTLADWLAVATGDLVPSAQARVRPEIEAHYAEAVRVHWEGGLPETQAHAAALADLGNAHSASLRFNQQYLTQPDANNLTQDIHFQVSNGAIWALLCIFGRFLPFLSPPLTCLVYLIGGILAYEGVFRLFKKYIRRTKTMMSRRTLILLATLAWLNVGLLLSSASDPDPILNLLLPLAFAMFALSTSLRCHLVWKKLARPHEYNPPPAGPKAA